MKKKAKRQIFLPSRTHDQDEPGKILPLHDRDADIERRVKEADAEAALPPLTPDDIPFNPMFWLVVLWPTPAQTKVRGLYIAGESRRAEEILTHTGVLMKMGPSAFAGRTNAGIELSQGLDRSKLIGMTFGWMKHTGVEYQLTSGHRVIVMNDSELLIDNVDASKIRRYLD